jgi:hypothetical protein
LLSEKEKLPVLPYALPGEFAVLPDDLPGVRVALAYALLPGHGGGSSLGMGMRSR